MVDEKGGEITVETDPTGYGNLQNDNKSVRSQQTTVDEEIVPTIPLKLELKLLEKIPKAEQMSCPSSFQKVMTIII